MKKYIALLFTILAAPSVFSEQGAYASYAEAQLSSCPITQAEYVVVDAYMSGCEWDAKYLPTFKLFTTADAYSPLFVGVTNINFYHIESSNLPAAQACYGVPFTGSPQTMVFKNGQIVAVSSMGDMDKAQLNNFLSKDGGLDIQWQ